MKPHTCLANFISVMTYLVIYFELVMLEMQSISHQLRRIYDLRLRLKASSELLFALAISHSFCFFWPDE